MPDLLPPQPAHVELLARIARDGVPAVLSDPTLSQRERDLLELVATAFGKADAGEGAAVKTQAAPARGGYSARLVVRGAVR